jgi:hypothetical protein
MIQGGIQHQQPKTNKALANKYLTGGTKADTYERPKKACLAMHSNTPIRAGVYNTSHPEGRTLPSTRQQTSASPIVVTAWGKQPTNARNHHTTVRRSDQQHSECTSEDWYKPSFKSRFTKRPLSCDKCLLSSTFIGGAHIFDCHQLKWLTTWHAERKCSLSHCAFADISAEECNEGITCSLKALSLQNLNQTDMTIIVLCSY